MSKKNSQLDLIELQLERIADALDDMLPLLEKIANPPLLLPAAPSPPSTPPTYPFPNGGYRCAGCGTWVMPGTMHACTGKTWPTTSPNICGSSSTYKGPKTITWNFPIAGTSVGETITMSDPSYLSKYGGV